jgi:MscS family membrane protein
MHNQDRYGLSSHAAYYLPYLGLVLLLGANLPARASAQEAAALGQLDTTSPRATFQTFIGACNAFHEHVQSVRHFDRRSPLHRPLVRNIVDCLDTSELPEFARDEFAAEAAVCIKEILDRIALPPDYDVPGLEEIEAAGGPDELSRWHIPGSRLTIARVEHRARRDEYLFTPGSVERAPEYFEEIRSLPYRTTGPEVSPGLYDWFISAPGHPLIAKIVDRLPEWTRRTVFGMSLWKWLGLAIALLIAVSLMGILYRLQQRLAYRWRETAPLRYCLTILIPVVAIFIPLAFSFVAKNHLTIRGTPLMVVSFSANLTSLLASLVVVFGLINRIAQIIIASPQINPQGLNAQFIRIAFRMAGIIASVIILLEGGQYLGIPVTTLLASAGVGGLAVALAAQHTLKNVFGTMMLMADKPFRVGDRILVRNYDGIVESIGLRSTRIRLLTGHMVTMPNDSLADYDIENIGSRPHIRRVADIHIPLNTPTDRLEKAVDIIRTALENHEGMDPDFPPRVYFNEFNSDSFNVRIICWYTPPAYWDFLAFSQRANLEICRVFEEQGIRFSLPDRIAHTSIEGSEKPVDVRLLQ